MTNAKILDNFSIYTGWGELIVLLSIASYFLMYWLENLLPSINVLYGTFGNVMTHPVTYIAILFCGFSIFTLDIILKVVKQLMGRYI